MKITLTIHADHAILGDQALVRRDIADKLTSVADKIRNDSSGNWRRGTMRDNDNHCYARWQGERPSQKQKDKVAGVVSKIDDSVERRYGRGLNEMALQSYFDELMELGMDFYE